MGHAAHPFFGGGGLPSPLDRLVDDAADLCEAIARLHPDGHWLLGPFVNFGSDHDEEFQFFQLLFARPGSTEAERATFEGQVCFWQRYIEALDAVLRGGGIRAVQIEADACINRWRSS